MIPSIAGVLERVAASVEARRRPDGTWGIGVEPFYCLSQTAFAVRVLSWRGDDAIARYSDAMEWLSLELHAEHLPQYTRTLAWPLYLFRKEEWPSASPRLMLGERLAAIRNRDGSWGHAANYPGKPLPTALALFGLSRLDEAGMRYATEIREGVRWLRDWLNLAGNDTLGSWAITLLALADAKTHELPSGILAREAHRLADALRESAGTPFEIIPNAARHLDAPYVLPVDPWGLTALTRLADPAAFAVQFQVLHRILRSVDDHGEVRCVPGEVMLGTYGQFNVSLALRTFATVHGGDKFLQTLVEREDVIQGIRGGSRRSRPKVFVGSSAESIPVARKVQANFEYDPFDTVIWNQGIFRPSQTTIESIEAATLEFDFAIMLLLPDDIELSRGEIRPAIRDNVLFELGLFTGALGRGRVFMVRPRIRGMKWPTDLLAVTPVEFDPQRFSTEPAAALGTACDEIRTEILRLGARLR